MTKRILALVLVLLTAVPFLGVSEQYDKVFDDLGNFLLYVDRVLEDERFVLEYVEAFNNNRTQDNLLIARTAVASALREIKAMEVPSATLTNKESMMLMLEGVEVEALTYLYDHIDVVKDGAIADLLTISDTLLFDVCFEPALENLMKKCRLYSENIVFEARDMVYTTNYLLLQLNSDSTGEFWQYIYDNTAVLKDEMVFNTDYEALVKLESGNIDQIARIYEEIKDLGAFEDYFIDITIQAAETGDVSVFKNNRTEIIGEGVVFPMPEWGALYDAEYLYIFSEPGTDDLYLHTMGSEITKAPDRIKITAPGITIDDMQMYLDSLTVLEYNPVYEFDTVDGVTTLYLMAQKDASQLMIVWNENETVLYLAPPVVSLVPYMYWK